jgi:hypothetical protein
MVAIISIVLFYIAGTFFIEHLNIFFMMEYLDVSKLGFQQAVTPVMYGIIALHDYIFSFLIVIFYLVLYLVISSL